MYKLIDFFGSVWAIILVCEKNGAQGTKNDQLLNNFKSFWNLFHLYWSFKAIIPKNVRLPGALVTKIHFEGYLLVNKRT